MTQALICLREYDQNGNELQKQVAKKADALLKAIDCSFLRNGQDVLYGYWALNGAAESGKDYNTFAIGIQ